MLGKVLLDFVRLRLFGPLDFDKYLCRNLAGRRIQQTKVMVFSHNVKHVRFGERIMILM